MSGEIRVDPLSGLRVIVAPDGPVLTPDAPAPAPFAKPALFTALAARGAQEELPAAARRLAELSADAVATVVDGWRERMRAHADAAYVQLTCTEVPAAPAPSTTLHALDFVPALVARERERFGAYAAQTMGGNLLGDLVQEEVRLRDRVVAIDDEAVLLVPFAAPAAFALMLVPRRVRARFEDDGPTGAALLHDGLKRISRRLGAPGFDLWVRTAPLGADPFCWHVDVVPRPRGDGGLEVGTGVPVTSVAPERAAAELREA